MKRICLLLIATLIATGTYAQGNKKDKAEKHSETHNMSSHIDSEAHAMMYADKVATRLGLSLEQKQQIQVAQMKRLESQKEMMAEMMEESGNMGANKEEKRNQKMKIQEDFKEEMKEILSSSQYKEWQPMYEREMKMHSDKKYKNKARSKDKTKDDSEF